MPVRWRSPDRALRALTPEDAGATGPLTLPGRTLRALAPSPSPPGPLRSPRRDRPAKRGSAARHPERSALPDGTPAAARHGRGTPPTPRRRPTRMG
ncbi:hypothetical protein GCM10010447_51380 [Streptomyces fulvorobeus]